MLVENRCDVLAGDGDRAADVLLAVVAQVAAPERDAPALGVEEAEQQVHDRRLARRRSRPTSATRPPGLEPQADAVEHQAAPRTA